MSPMIHLPESPARRFPLWNPMLLAMLLACAPAVGGSQETPPTASAPATPPGETEASAPEAAATEPPIPTDIDAAATEVKVERVRPAKEKHPTLRFLKENRDFIRGRFDLLREKPVERSGDAAEVDPRFLAYSKMLAEVFMARDSAGTAERDFRQRLLFASVTELGELEGQLDLMERLLDEQRYRLSVLQRNFTGDQKTALMVVLSGYPGEAAPSQVALRMEDGATLAVPLSPEQRESLRRGGVIQVFHALVEPREQVLEVTLGGESWPAGDSGFVTLNPARDRLTFLRLDLSQVRPDQGAPSIQASFWLHEARIPPVDG